jgi:hypothetical protein
MLNISTLPIKEDKGIEFWRLYNKTHAEEHQNICNWINALAKAKGLNIAITYYQLPILDPEDKRAMIEFFNTNRLQHQLFYEYINLIGNRLTIAMYVFPKNYPASHYDMDIENFLKFEKDIHMLFFRAIDEIKNNL